MGKRPLTYMLWMERFALMFYIVFNIFVFGLNWLLAASMKENVTFDEIKQIFIFCLIATFIVWFLFRMIDFLFAGPLRREIKKGQELIKRSNFNH